MDLKTPYTKEDLLCKLMEHPFFKQMYETLDLKLDLSKDERTIQHKR